MNSWMRTTSEGRAIPMTTAVAGRSTERDEVLEALAEQRQTFLIALRGLSDAQISARTTVSDLTLGGLLKHLTRGETVWTQVIRSRDGALPDGMLDMGQYYLSDGETLAG